MGTSSDQDRDIEALLRVCVQLLAAQIGDDLPLSERAPLLARLGLDRVAIAQVCDTSPEIVSVRLAEAKKRTPSRAKRRKDPRSRGK
jgi:hypothetical protein